MPGVYRIIEEEYKYRKQEVMMAIFLETQKRSMKEGVYREKRWKRLYWISS